MHHVEPDLGAFVKLTAQSGDFSRKTLPPQFDSGIRYFTQNLFFSNILNVDQCIGASITKHF